jgi:hypothetical protein
MGVTDLNVGLDFTTGGTSSQPHKSNPSDLAVLAAWRYSPRFIFAEQLDRQSPPWLLLEIDIGEGLPGVIAEISRATAAISVCVPVFCSNIKTHMH